MQRVGELKSSHHNSLSAGSALKGPYDDSFDIHFGFKAFRHRACRNFKVHGHFAPRLDVVRREGQLEQEAC